MKKTLTLIAAATLSALSFASWADTLTVGASNTPHAEILEQAKPILAKQGIDLEIKPFQDYILPNTALAGREIDANYFQHQNRYRARMEQCHCHPARAIGRGVAALSGIYRREAGERGGGKVNGFSAVPA